MGPTFHFGQLSLESTFFGVLLAFLVFFVLLTAIPILVANWRIFKRYYELPGWYSLIPFYSSYLQSQKTFGSSFGYIGIVVATSGGLINVVGFSTIIGSILAFAASIFSMWYTYRTLERLTDSILLILFSFIAPFITLPIIAFSKEGHYKGPKPPCNQPQEPTSPKEEQE